MTRDLSPAKRGPPSRLHGVVPGWGTEGRRSVLGVPVTPTCHPPPLGLGSPAPGSRQDQSASAARPAPRRTRLPLAESRLATRGGGAYASQSGRGARGGRARVGPGGNWGPPPHNPAKTHKNVTRILRNGTRNPKNVIRTQKVGLKLPKNVTGTSPNGSRTTPKWGQTPKQDRNFQYWAGILKVVRKDTKMVRKSHRMGLEARKWIP